MADSELKNTYEVVLSENVEVCWQTDKTMLECNKYMFDHELATDITFTVTNKLLLAENEGEQDVKSRNIKAHKYILLARSPVFWKMFNRKYSEQTGSVQVDDVDPDAFYHMIMYLYTDEIEMTPDLVMFILHVSKKYMISNLEKECFQFLETSLDTSNACMLLDQSLFFDEKRLAATCLRTIATDTAKCFESDSFLEIAQTTLCHMLNNDMFSVKEIEIFKACLRWATHACTSRGMEVCGDNLREVLGTSLDLIHFPVISVHDFSTIVCPSGILPQENKIKLLRYLKAKASDIENPVKSPDVLPEPDPYPYNDRYFTGPYHTGMDTSKLVIKCIKQRIADCNSSGVIKTFVYNMQINSTCPVFINEISISNLAIDACHGYFMKIKEIDIVLGSTKHIYKPTGVSIPNPVPVKLDPTLSFEEGTSSFLIEVTVGTTCVWEIPLNYRTAIRESELSFKMMPDSVLEYNNPRLNVHLQVKCLDTEYMPITGFKFFYGVR